MAQAKVLCRRIRSAAIASRFPTAGDKNSKNAVRARHVRVRRHSHPRLPAERTGVPGRSGASSQGFLV